LFTLRALARCYTSAPTPQTYLQGAIPMADLEQLKQKYASVLNLIAQAGVRLSHTHIQDNKLFIQGAAGSEEIKNRIWDQIKLVNPAADDITCDLTVDPSLAPAPKVKTYTVAAGDSLSKIAKNFYGNAGQYMKIFEANKGTLTDPDKIKVGQELVIPE
jgi:nucleoid-associated protein YgaU